MPDSKSTTRAPAQAMLLAAGHGRRMGTLTAERPKPLLEVGGRSLIEHQVDRLVRAGITRLVVNLGPSGELIADRLGDGTRLGASISYSREGAEPLETGGGIYQALAEFGSAPFVAVNADLWADFEYASLPAEPDGLAHLVLVPNPAHHAQGDFALAEGRVRLLGPGRATYSGIGVLRPELFADCAPGRFGLAPVLRQAVAQGQVSGELFLGTWIDVGTPDRLRAAEAVFAATQQSR